MDEQQPVALVHHPRGERLYPNVVERDGYRIAEAAWLRARAAGEVVGTCRACGSGHLEPLPTPPPHHLSSDQSLVNWNFGAVCTNCGHDYAAPDGKVLKESSRHSEQPKGWRSKRVQALKGRDK